MVETWKSIHGYEGLYEISNNGQVKMLGRIKKYRWGNTSYVEPKTIAQCLVCGYKKVKLRGYDGKTKMYSVHRLVAETFIPNPHNYPQVNHKDENKSNNNVDNLEWCTAKYNANYGTGIKRCTLARLKPILQFSKDGEFIRKWDSMKDVVNSLGISYSRISQACNGITKTSCGYIWKFSKKN